MEDWLLSFANQKIRMPNKFFPRKEFLEKVGRKFYAKSRRHIYSYFGAGSFRMGVHTAIQIPAIRFMGKVILKYHGSMQSGLVHLIAIIALQIRGIVALL